MRFLLLNHIQNAHQSLRSSRLRTTLTVLGVTIGVASITTILALSGGASKVVSNQVDALGGNIAVIKPGKTPSSPLTSITNVQSHRDYATTTLKESDLSLIANTEHVKATAPIMVLSGAVKSADASTTDTPIVATTPALATISNLDTREGQFFDDHLTGNVAVVGTQLSIDLFGTEESIGKTFTIRGVTFTVVGILKRLNDPINYNSIDFDTAVIVNLQSGKLLNQGAAQIQQINVQADSVSNLNQTIIDLTKALTRNHDDETDFSILSGTQIAQPTSVLFYTIAGITAAVAAISLLVGGIGIMNIMLVSVAERTREIGIRKALGASNGDIVAQFLIESLYMGIGGGIAGYILGYLTAFAISTFLTFSPIITWEIAAVALGISVVMGVTFGLYPAFRASRKDPIDSLRQV